MTEAYSPRYTIDRMADGDWEQVRAIYVEGIATGNATFERDVPTWEAWDRSHLPDCRLVARIEASVIGWVALSPVSGRCVYAGVAESSSAASIACCTDIGCPSRHAASKAASPRAARTAATRCSHSARSAGGTIPCATARRTPATPKKRAAPAAPFVQGHGSQAVEPFGGDEPDDILAETARLADLYTAPFLDI